MKPSDRFWEILGERAKMPRAKGYDEDGEMWMTLLTLLDESQEPKALKPGTECFERTVNGVCTAFARMANEVIFKEPKALEEHGEEYINGCECDKCFGNAMVRLKDFMTKPQDEPKKCGKCDEMKIPKGYCIHQESETGNTTVNTAILGSDCVCLKWNPEANFTHTGPCLCGQPVFVGRCALEGIHYCNERGGKTSHTKPQDEPKEESAIGDLILDFQFNNGLQVGNSIIHMIGHSKDGKPMVKLQSGDTQFLKSLEK